ncbi:uncharacterized protein EI90DRAFT_3114955 [Cantharellus anzutake]|uniref:uncharacterized protein n=1 Tax=Cantharellus anzutake TaxID=1750568 RepID=UPI0019042E30|nr:uncharacterized protein EI90DRAFT_3114955 [Cantharellus anzutake]KAF8344202.1 hypothetical protein EI90DRAFT_3114955 [Cantharellus anzutake]
MAMVTVGFVVSHVLSALVVPLGPEQPQQPQQQGQPQQQSSLPGSTSEEATAVAPGLRLNTNVGASVLNGADTQSPAPQTQQTQHPTISTPLDMILYILGPKGKQLFPPELRSNACSLLSSVGRKDAEVSNLLSSSSATAVTESSGKGKAGLLNEVKRRARPIILALVNEQGGFGGGVGGGDSVPISPVSTTSTGTGIIGGRNPQLVRNAALRTLSVWGRA